jgi:hypothetical protein
MNGDNSQPVDQQNLQDLAGLEAVEARDWEAWREALMLGFFLLLILPFSVFVVRKVASENSFDMFWKSILIPLVLAVLGLLYLVPNVMQRASGIATDSNGISFGWPWRRQIFWHDINYAEYRRRWYGFWRLTLQTRDRQWRIYANPGAGTAVVASAWQHLRRQGVDFDPGEAARGFWREIPDTVSAQASWRVMPYWLYMAGVLIGTIVFGGFIVLILILDIFSGWYWHFFAGWIMTCLLLFFLLLFWQEMKHGLRYGWKIEVDTEGIEVWQAFGHWRAAWNEIERAGWHWFSRSKYLEIHVAGTKQRALIPYWDIWDRSEQVVMAAIRKLRVGDPPQAIEWPPAPWGRKNRSAFSVERSAEKPLK